MTLLQEMGFSCKRRDLSREDQNRYLVEQRKRTPRKYNAEKSREANRRNWAKPEHREWVANYWSKPENVARREGYKNNPVNIEKARVKSRDWMRNRRNSDPGFRVMTLLRGRISDLCKAGKGKSVSLGLSAEEIRTHLESQFDADMNWDNYGTYWHVDHIIPCSHFDFTDQEQIKSCMSLKNLRPLKAVENLRKSDKLLPEFSDLAEELKPAKTE